MRFTRPVTADMLIKTVRAHCIPGKATNNWPRTKFLFVRLIAVLQALGVDHPQWQLVAELEHLQGKVCTMADLHEIMLAHGWHEWSLCEWEYIDRALCPLDVPPAHPAPAPDRQGQIAEGEPKRKIAREDRMPVIRHRIIARLQDRLRKTRQMLKREKLKVAQLRQLAKDHARRSESMYMVGTRARKRNTTCYRRLSIAAGFRMALNKNVGHGSGSSFIVTSDVQTSRQNVMRWERMLADSVLSQSYNWYESYRKHAEELMGFVQQFEVHDDNFPPTPTVFTFELHSLTGDSTNSAVAHQHKAHVLNAQRTCTHYSPETETLTGGIRAMRHKLT